MIIEQFTDEIGKGISNRLNDSLNKAIANDDYKNRKQFAEEIGIEYHTVLDHLKGSRSFSIQYLRIYAQALGVSSDYLLFGKEYSGPTDHPKEPTIEDVYNAIDVLIGFFGLGLFTTNPANSKNPYNQTELVINDDGIAKYIDDLYELSNIPAAALNKLKEHGYDDVLNDIREKAIKDSKSSPAIYSIDEVSE